MEYLSVAFAEMLSHLSKEYFNIKFQNIPLKIRTQFQDKKTDLRWKMLDFHIFSKWLTEFLTFRDQNSNLALQSR